MTRMTGLSKRSRVTEDHARVNLPRGDFGMGRRFGILKDRISRNGIEP